MHVYTNLDQFGKPKQHQTKAMYNNVNTGSEGIQKQHFVNPVAAIQWFLYFDIETLLLFYF